MVQKYANFGMLKAKRDRVLVISMEMTNEKGRRSELLGTRTEMRKSFFGLPHLYVN